MINREFTHDSIHLAFYDNELMRMLTRIWECDDSIELFNLFDDEDYADAVEVIRESYIKAAKHIVWTAEAQGLINYDDWSSINSQLSDLFLRDLEDDWSCLD